MTALLNEVAGFPKNFALVLDDYQVIQSPPVHAAILFLLEHAPPRMHLVIASRTDLPFPLGRLRARDELNEIRAADLRFTPDETARFLNHTMGLDLSVESVISLEQYTEGWIAGLQLAGLALRGHDRQPGASSMPDFIRGLTGSHRHIVNYLVEEVLGQRPKGTLDFLLETSILETLSGPLCDYVLEKPHLHSQLILEQLEHANLFVEPLDEEGKWYRYHHLFADVLHARLQFGRPEKLKELHLRASEWYQQYGAIPDSVRHAVEAGEWERVAQLIEQYAIEFGSRGQIQLILGWLAALPEPVLRSHPLLCIFHAGALMYNNRLEDADARLLQAEAAVQGDTPAGQARVILGRVSMARANLRRMEGDVAGSVELARQALELLPDSDNVARANATLSFAHRFLTSGDVSPLTENVVISALESARASGNAYLVQRGTTLLARFYAMQGRLHRSAELFDGLAEQDETSPMMGIADQFFGLGDLNREWNHLAEAERILEQGVSQARGYVSDGDATMRGYQSLARLKQARGDTRGAMETLDEFTQLARKYRFAGEVLAQADAVQAWLDLMSGDVRAAARWAAARGIQTGGELSYPREREYLTLVRLVISGGPGGAASLSIKEVLRLLDRLQAAARADGRIWSLIETLVLQSTTFQMLGDRSNALKATEQAIALACPEGYTRVFLDEGEAMKSLIAAFVGMSLERTPVEEQHHGFTSRMAYANRLLAAFPGGAQHPAANAARRASLDRLAEPLSDREVEVLRLLAAGASNASISETLHIALSTVKRHTGNLYGKLGVNSRTQAIARSQRLGLIS